MGAISASAITEPESKKLPARIVLRMSLTIKPGTWPVTCSARPDNLIYTISCEW